MRVTAAYASPFSELTRLEEETVAFEGCTLADLVAALAERHGVKFRDAFVDAASGEIHPGIIALVDGRRIGLDAPLAEDVEVTFLMAMAGGS